MNDSPLLRMTGIAKSFPGVQALRGIDLELRAGEVLALLGENGAGKSTLIKVLAGAHTPDAGTIQLDGVEKKLRSPSDARKAGIAVIYQEFSLVPTLTAAENIFLGREGATWLRHGQERTHAEELFRRLGVAVDPDALCRDLPVAQQQAVEIARALATDSRILVMDEPSATLTPQEVERLFAAIRDLKSHGIGVIYISHRLDEIFAIADRVMVMRDGLHVATRPVATSGPLVGCTSAGLTSGPLVATGEVRRDELIEWMVGRRLDQEFPRRQSVPGQPRLVVKGLRRGDKVRDVSFEIRRGEVLGLTGLVGSGRTETCRLLFGADERDGGVVELDGRPLTLSSPRDAIHSGIALLTEDRKSQGLVLAHSARDNFALPNLHFWSRLGWLNRRRERTAFGGFIDSLSIRLTSPDQPARELSGGNQQKVVLARWLQRNCEVVLFDEPTRGIDVGARFEIYQLINELAEQGKAILMISSELPEVLGMSDRILVMHDGRVTGVIADVSAATQEQIMQLAVATTGPVVS